MAREARRRAAKRLVVCLIGRGRARMGVGGAVVAAVGRGGVREGREPC